MLSMVYAKSEEDQPDGGLDALRAYASLKRNCQGLKLLCYQRSIAPLCGKDNCPRASLNRHTSMSGIANSTQPVAMTARAHDKERQSSLKSKMLRRCGAHGRLDHHQNCKEQHSVSRQSAKPHNPFYGYSVMVYFANPCALLSTFRHIYFNVFKLN